MQDDLGGFENAWIEEDFLRCLRQRSVIGMVAASDPMGAGGKVYGFMIYSSSARKAFVPAR